MQSTHDAPSPPGVTGDRPPGCARGTGASRHAAGLPLHRARVGCPGSTPSRFTWNRSEGCGDPASETPRPWVAWEPPGGFMWNKAERRAATGVRCSGSVDPRSRAPRPRPPGNTPGWMAARRLRAARPTDWCAPFGIRRRPARSSGRGGSPEPSGAGRGQTTVEASRPAPSVPGWRARGVMTHDRVVRVRKPAALDGRVHRCVLLCVVTQSSGDRPGTRDGRIGTACRGSLVLRPPGAPHREGLTRAGERGDEEVDEVDQAHAPRHRAPVAGCAGC